ncbi:MAG TPA: hypothetical protein VH024_09285, partial [Candidatus Angelobacter sp.]|nr:hypothetical protein [Candidatus Angelobacter sp.]
QELTLLHLRVGNIAAAATWASRYVDEHRHKAFLWRSKMEAHAILAHVLHQKGEWRSALEHFDLAPAKRTP